MSIGFYISSDPREEYCNGLPAYIRCSTTGKRNFFVSRPHHKSTLLFHLKYYKMKENTFESSLSAEAKNRELPIDPELKEILLLVNEAYQRFEVFLIGKKKKIQ